MRRWQMARSPEKPKRMLGPQELYEAAKEVASIARSFRMRVAVLGGYAMQAFGSDRLTGDLDFVVSHVSPKIRAFRNLSFGGVGTMTGKGVQVDLIDRGDDERKLYRAALTNSKSMAGLPTKIVTPDYLIAIKMASGRPKDMYDFDFLATRMNERELESARRIVKKFMGWQSLKDFNQLVAIAQWQARRTR